MKAKIINVTAWIAATLASSILITNVLFLKIFNISGYVYSLAGWNSSQSTNLFSAILKLLTGLCIVFITAWFMKKYTVAIFLLSTQTNVRLSIFTGLIFGLTLEIGLFLASDAISMFSSYLVMKVFR